MRAMGWTLGLLGMVLAGAGEAGAAPWQIGTQGVIYTVDGRPAEGVHVVTFKVYASAQATTAAWEEDVPLGLVEGRFATLLPSDGDDLSLAAVLDEAEDAELAVVLDDGVELDRAPLAATPYAMVAERARHVAASDVSLTGDGATDVQAALVALTSRIASLEAGQGDGLPAGAVLMFTGACPSGWSEVTGLAGRVPLGVGAGFAIGTSGGATTHGHAVTVASAGAHVHDASTLSVQVDKLSGGMADLATWMPTIACATSSVSAGGSCSGFAASAIYHNHPAAASGSVASSGAHTHEATAAEASSLPPYQVVRFCAKPGEP